jgi:hypothetical protein
VGFHGGICDLVLDLVEALDLKLGGKGPLHFLKPGIDAMGTGDAESRLPRAGSTISVRPESLPILFQDHNEYNDGLTGTTVVSDHATSNRKKLRGAPATRQPFSSKNFGNPFNGHSSPKIGTVNLHDFGAAGYCLGNAFLKIQGVVPPSRFPGEPLKEAIEKVMGISDSQSLYRPRPREKACLAC